MESQKSPLDRPATVGRGPAEPQPSCLFVNRLREVEIVSHFESYQVAAITGPIGVGKSMLAREAILRAQASGFTTIKLEPSFQEELSLASWLPEIAKVMREALGEASPSRDLKLYGLQNPLALHKAFIRVLQRKKMFILVENIHLLEAYGAPAAFLNALCMDTGLSRILITSRNEIPWTSWLCTPHVEIELSGFDSSTIQEYFQAINVSCPKAIVRILERQHRGWPVIVSEIASKLAHTPVTQKGLRHFLQQTRGRLAPTLTNSIIARVSETGRNLLSYLTCLKVPVSFDELATITGVDKENIRGTWNELARAGALRPHLDPLDSVHDLIKSNVDLVVPDPATVHRRLGVFFRITSGSPERILASVEHFRQIPDPPEAAKTLVLAGESLIRAGHSHALLEALAGIEPSDIPEHLFLSLALLRANALESKGKVDEAEDTLLTFFYDEILRILEPSVLVAYYYRMARIKYFRADYPSAEVLIHTAIRAIDDNQADGDRDLLLARARCLTLLGRIQYVRRDLYAAENHYRDALSLQKELGDEYGANKVLHRLAMIDHSRGNSRAALAGFRSVERNSQRLGDAKRFSYALHRIGEILAEEGDLKTAEKYFRKSLAVKVKIGHTRGRVYSSLELALIAEKRDDLEAAERWVREALTQLSGLDMPKEKAIAYRNLGELRIRQGRVAEGAQWLRKAANLFASLGLSRRASAIKAKLTDLMDSHAEA